MSQYDDHPWPWPTRTESESLARLLNEPDVLIEQHQHPESIHASHPDGRSLWATMLDPIPSTSERISEGPLPSLAHPVTAEDRAALAERMKAIRREAPVYGAHVQARSPQRENPYLAAEVEDLKRQAAAALGRTRGEST